MAGSEPAGRSFGYRAADVGRPILRWDARTDPRRVGRGVTRRQVEYQIALDESVRLTCNRARAGGAMAFKREVAQTRIVRLG